MKVLENDKNKLIVELPELDHTLLNVLKDELNQDSNVEVAAYSKDHPEVGTPKLIVETSKGEPKKAILDALKRLSEKNKAFLKAF